MKKNLLILFCFVASINKIHSQTNWDLLNPKPTSNTGKNIEFVSNNVGYIITSNELLETIDSGVTWLKKQNISSGNDISFHQSIGFIVGNNGFVLKTEDSGVNWSQINTGFDTSSFNTVNIIDNNIIILSSSNSIIKSNNGGLTWQSFTIPNVTVIKTAFTNSLVGHTFCNDGMILKTIDGGVNWYVTQNSSTSLTDFFTVYFVNENVGYSSRASNSLYKTTDGGETWIQISGTSEAIYDFHFLDENNGFTTGDHGATFKTTNGGITWDQIFFQNGFIYDTSMYGIYFQDSNIGFATGARGRIIKTINGGATWTQHSVTYDDFNDIKLLDNGVGFARTRNNYYKTTDSGDNWSYISSVNHFSFCNGSYFVNENVGYSIGGGSSGISGDVFKTIDGGITWSQLNINVDEGLNSVFFINENIGFVSGGFNQRKVMKTTNGGLTWTQVLNQRFGQIQFLNNDIGYANLIGYSYGRMYKTIDGGNTWNISIEVDKQINAFDFIDENNGYFVGDQGLIYKTNNGGTNWEELNIPYDWYTEVNFYTKNVGYIADEEGRLYKTENGGLNWQNITQQYAINSIEIINDKIYTAGTNGKIYKSTVTYEPIVLNVNPVENVTNSSASLTGNATSNGQPISNIKFEYSLDNSFNNSISTIPNIVAANDSSNLSVSLINLQSNTTYFYKLTALVNSNINSSQILSFTTLPDYSITTNFTNNYTSTTAQISGTIVSNGYDITNVEFQYGTSSNALNSTSIGTQTFVLGNTTGNITAGLLNLEPQTQYFYRIKATHQGQVIYGNVMSFTTYPEYNINLYNPNINGNNVTLSAYLTSYNQDITDIVFEYGTLNYDNNISTNLSQINANSSNYVSATISNLDTNSNYYYRLKAKHNGEIIYSNERVFNFSGNIIVASGTTQETENAIELKGLINSYGAYLTDIHFEYGVTSSLGSSISGTPNLVYDLNTNLITGLISNPLENQIYFYRLVATHNGNLIYSDIYQYKTLGNTAIEKEIVLYPNPASDFLYIKSNDSNKVKDIEFYNTLGNRVYYVNVSNLSAMKIDVSNLKKGIYLVKLNFENSETTSSKLIMN